MSKVNTSENAQDIVIENVVVTKNDRAKERSYTWLCYILFFIPYLFNPQSKFVQVHTKNAIKLFLMDLCALIFLLLGIYFGKSVSYNIMILFIFITLIGITLFCVSLITKLYLIVMCIKGKNVSLPIR